MAGAETELGSGPAWDRLKDIVADALDLEPSAQGVFLEKACAGDALLLAEAWSILEAGRSRTGTCVLDRRVDRFLGLHGPDTAALTGRRFGRYELVRLLGEGAMSAVYLAKQPGLDRPVAVKVLRPHAIGYDAIGRFSREVKALGRLDHPGVARILDAGVERDADAPGARGVPYIAMEYVPGLPLVRAAREAQLSIIERLKLMASVVDAVHAAHQRALIHRDLKPDNVLVIPADRPGVAGTPKVLDFGIARVLDRVDGTPDGQESRTVQRVATLQTTAGVLLGTLGYMSPEQARGASEDVDVRSDIYALGVMLHELVTGRLPVETAGMPLTQALMRLGDPEVSTGSIGPIRNDSSAGDLHTILTTALASERERRYPSADAFADDLRRLLANEPITARPPTRTYRTRKFVQRHRVAVAGISAVILTLTAGTVAISIGFLLESRARRAAMAAKVEAETAKIEAESARNDAIAAQREVESALAVADAQNRRSRAARRFLGDILESADLDSAAGSADITLLQAVRDAQARLGTQPGDDPLVESELRVTLARALRSLGDIDAANQQYHLARDAARRALIGGDVNALTELEIVFEHAQSLATAGWAAEARQVLDTAEAQFNEMRDLVASHASHDRFLVEAVRARAAVLDAEGRWGKAADLYVEAVAQAEKLVGDDPGQVDLPELSRLQNNAGSALLSAGRIDEGRQLLEATLAWREQTYGPDHVATLTAHLNYAHAVWESGDLAEAERLFRHVATKAGEVLPESHPLRPNALDALVGVLGAQRSPQSLEEAIRIGRDLVALRRKHDDGSSDLLFSLNNLANALAYAERFAEAADVFRETAEVAVERLGAEHPTSLVVRSNLAQMLGELGQVDEALAEMRTVQAIQANQFGAENQSVVISRNNIAMFLLEAGRPGEAVGEFEWCVGVSEAHGWGALTPLLRRNLGRALLNSDRLDEAEDALLLAYDEAASLGEGQQQRTAEFLAQLYDTKNAPAEADRWRRLSGEVQTTSP